MRVGLRQFSSGTAGWLREALIAGELTRSALARQLCEREDWRNRKGELCAASARKALPVLARHCGLRLPAPSNSPPSREGFVAGPVPRTEFAGSLAQLGRVRLVRVEHRGDRATWHALLDACHPLGIGRAPGWRVSYLVRSRRQGVLGGLSFAAAAARPLLGLGASQQPPLSVAQDVAQMRAERLAAAARVVALHPFLPLRDRLLALRQLQLQRPQAVQVRVDERPRGAARRDRDGLVAAASPAPRRRQRQHAQPLELLQHVQRQPDATATALGLPPQVLANGLAELVAAQPRQRRGHLLHVRDLASGQPLAEERGELEALDAGVDGGGRTHPKTGSQNRAKMLSVIANKISNDSATSVLSVLYQTPHLRHPLQRYNRMPLASTRA